MEGLKIFLIALVVLIVLCWVLAKSIISDGVKNFFFSLVFVAFIFAGIALGFWGGITIENLPSTGMFTSWELLDSPVKFTQIADLSSDGVWAETTDNKLYFWGFGYFCYSNPQAKCNQWVEAKNIPSDAHRNDFTPLNKGKSCPENRVYPKKYPGKIVECAFLSLRGPAFQYFALLEDGTLWIWSPPYPTDVPLVAIFIGPSIGLMLGILLGVVFLRTLQKRYKISIKW